MHILHIINVRWFNATAWYAFRLAKAGKDVGDCPAIAGLENSPIIQTAKSYGIATFEAIFNSNNPFVIFKNFFKLKKFIKKFVPDVVVCHRGEMFWLIAFYKFLFRPKWKLIRVRGDIRPPTKDIISKFTHNICTDKIITPNKFMAENYLKFLNTSPNKVEVIYGGVDTLFFKPDNNLRQKMRKEFGFNNEDLVISVVGRFDPVKGHKIFLEACGQVYNEGLKNLKILLIGFPANISSDEIMAMAKISGVDHITYITGKRNDINALMNACDLGVISSIGSEAICRVAMELMASGVSVIASTAGVLPEMFPNENLYEMFNSNELSQRIKKHKKFLQIYDERDFYKEFKKACKDK